MIVWYVVLLVRYGNAAVGTSRWKTTVLPPFAAWMLPDLRTPLNAERAPPPPLGSVLRLNVAMTSAAVSGEPSWNLTPWRRLNAHWVPSLFVFQLVASRGEIVLSAFVCVRYSPQIEPVANVPWSANWCGSMGLAGAGMMPTRSLPPALTALGTARAADA